MRLPDFRMSTLKDKIVIIVDDGVTGMTAVAAVQTARLRGAAHVVMAAPVMSLQSYHELYRTATT